MKSILPLIAKIVIRSIVKGLEKDVTRYNEKSKVAVRGESAGITKIAKKAAAKKAALKAKRELIELKEREEKSKLFAKGREVQAKRDAAKAELAKFKKLDI